MCCASARSPAAAGALYAAAGVRRFDVGAPFGGASSARWLRRPGGRTGRAPCSPRAARAACPTLTVEGGGARVLAAPEEWAATRAWGTGAMPVRGHRRRQALCERAQGRNASTGAPLSVARRLHTRGNGLEASSGCLPDAGNGRERRREFSRRRRRGRLRGPGARHRRLRAVTGGGMLGMRGCRTWCAACRLARRHVRHARPQVCGASTGAPLSVARRLRARCDGLEAGQGRLLFPPHAARAACPVLATARSGGARVLAAPAAWAAARAWVTASAPARGHRRRHALCARPRGGIALRPKGLGRARRGGPHAPQELHGRRHDTLFGKQPQSKPAVRICPTITNTGTITVAPGRPVSALVWRCCHDVARRVR